MDIPEYPQPSPPEPGSSEILDSLVDEYHRAAAAGDHARADRIRCREIPEAMAHSNQGFTPAEYLTASGYRVTLARSTRINVPAGKRKELYQWLADAGHAEVLSTIKSPFKPQQRRKAETAALVPLVERLLEQGRHVPLDLIGISQTWVAKVAPPRMTG